MAQTLYWLQCGGCGGDSMSLLSAESPSILEALQMLDIQLLWHPSLSNGSHLDHARIIEEITAAGRPLDYLCVEGAVITGPEGSGMFERTRGRAKQDLVADLAHQARHVIAVGTCSSFGGISADCEVEATGLQFKKEHPDGFLGANFTTGAGNCVINLPGCPCHPEVVIGTLTALSEGRALDLDRYNRPVEWFGMMVHQGCTRNEYHEYRIEERDFGEKGCLFFHLGCQGPLVYGPCNKLLWNRRSCKTRVGVPCFGCVSPAFPQETPFFETPNIEGLPFNLPDGVDRAHYMAYKSMAAAAAPERLIIRKTKV